MVRINIKARSSGQRWEKRVFGVCSGGEFITWRPFDDAIAEVIEREDLDWNPKCPRRKVALELFECVKSYLPSEFAEELEFHCAIGTSLDWHHQTDGFFRVGRYIVCIDLTVNNTKKDAEGENVVVFHPREAGVKIWRVAHKIALCFLAAEPS